MDVTTQYDAIIVGAGAAGLTAAVMLGRSRRRVLVVSTRDRRNSTATSMRNVPFAHGERPEVVYAKMERDAERSGVEFLWEAVDDVQAFDEHVAVRTRAGDTYTARRTILATGRYDRIPAWLPEDTWGKTVFECPYCHTYENAGKDFAVVGDGGNTIWMARLAQAHAGRMTVVVRDPEAVSQEQEAADRLIHDGADIVVDQVESARTLNSGEVELRTVQGREIVVGVVLLAEVAQPDQRFTKPLGLQLTEQGYPRTDINGRTSHPLVYSAGNALGTSYYMWTGAASSGLNAARAAWEDFVME
ncbi:NAD(P)/FAD-dependent oxidoreductase [Streptomyces sp. NPDC059696]|uniref:NAD(P)/FAD-dependent oxidoreductase n=1 Tax=Streptomyces sp. NPDC059696 TaxID=3346911 RepID=UPI00368885A2